MGRMEPAGRSTWARVTRRDVAERAQVSTAVVSYVLNGGPGRVSESTKARVRQAIAELGYRPNQTARALSTGSSHTLGMVVPDAATPFFASLARAVEESAARRGFALLLANSGSSPDLERLLIADLAGRRVDGLVLCSTILEPDLRELSLGEIPVVLLNHWARDVGVPAVGTDLRAGAREAVAHLVAAGHRSVALVIGANIEDYVDEREIGWAEALDDAGLERGPVIRTQFSRRGGYLAAAELLGHPTSPTAVFVSSDAQAVGLLHALHERAVAIPSQMAVISLDGTEDSEYTWPPLSTVAQPIEQMAETAIRVILEQPEGDPVMLLPPTLILRASSEGIPA